VTSRDREDSWDPSLRPYRISEVAALFGVTVQAVHAWLKTGRILVRRRTSRRGSFLIPRSEVARLLRVAGREIPGLWTRPRVRVLVIDDDRGIRRLAVAAARSPAAPMELRTAAGVEDGLLLAGEFQPDVILLDAYLRRSGFRGDDAVAFIRKARRLRHARIVAMAPDRGMGRLMREAGADGVLIKPFGLDEFRAEVLKYSPSLKG